MRDRIAGACAVLGMLAIVHAIMVRAETPIEYSAAEFGVGVLFLVVSLIVSWRVWL